MGLDISDVYTSTRTQDFQTSCRTFRCLCIALL